MSDLSGIWTQYGLDRAAELLAAGKKLEITHAAVGNGGGAIPAVQPSQTGLIGEEWRGAVNDVAVNPQNSTDVIVSAVIPNNVGEFWVREWGLFDDVGGLVAVGPHDEMHKPVISSGQAAEYLERFHLPISNTGQISLSIATEALATQSFVRGEIARVEFEIDSLRDETQTNFEAVGAVIDHLVPRTRKIIAGTGLSGGGDLTADRTITLGIVPVALGGTGANTAEQARVNLGLASSQYELCEFYYFRHPTLKPGFASAQGGLLANAATLYPEAWAYLQTTDGQLLCKTEAQWQAMTTAIWATLADGSAVGWNGIGGAPYYVQDLAAGTLRLPDLRGMYAEAAGFDALGVGGVHGDAVRNVTGKVAQSVTDAQITSGAVSGAVTTTDAVSFGVYGNAHGSSYKVAYLNISRVVPVGNANKPRAWGTLACVYLGQPAS